MFSYVQSWFSNPIGMLTFFLLALPGRMIALSAHEAAHAWMANKCGDPTARMMGRMTLNPFKHLEPVGTVMMLLLGIGWARPVPVNPRNYRNYRRDDLLVSIAGVAMNLILFIVGFLLMGLIAALTLRSLPHYSSLYAGKDEIFVALNAGEQVLVSGSYYYSIRDLFTLAPYLSDLLITPVAGRLLGYIYQMLMYFVLVNFSLAIFNLLPVPPLDGYHVFNDLLFKRSLFASPKASRVAYGILVALVFCTDIISRLINAAETLCMNGLGTALFSLLSSIGLL